MQTGPSQNGRWTVSSDGSHVVQSLNEHATFFVSPGDFFNTTITGSLQVNFNRDDDQIGFVFGYNAGENVATLDDDSYFLMEWTGKETSSDGNNANDPNREGIRLFKVNGDSIELLGLNVGPQTGWRPNVLHTFTLEYYQDRLAVMVDESFMAEVIGNFPTGKFGFYNYSQPNVTYSGFSEKQECQTYYADVDSDGFGDENNTTFDCVARDGFVSNSDDCDDSNPNINPNATEIPNNGIDEDCKDGDLIQETFDCPDLSLNFGDACNDGNANTTNDLVLFDCNCVGQIVYDCTDLNLNIGDTCDDGDSDTANDTVDGSCNCVGEQIDCENILGGDALPGTVCDDGHSNTFNDMYDTDCNCLGERDDCGCEGMEVVTVCQNGQTKRVNCNALSDPSVFCGPCEDAPPVCKECNYNDNGTITICWIPNVKDNFRTLTGDCEYLKNFFDQDGNMMGENECGSCNCSLINDVDTDGDGICDRKDECPNNPNKDKAGSCGCDDEDSDNDGICDDEDICEGYDDNLDSDNDGTPDGCDECPDNTEKTEKGECGCEDCPIEVCEDLCIPRGDSEFEWIDKISMNQLENKTGSNNGYGDFRHIVLELGRGDSLSLWVFLGYLENICELSVHIYADWNGDCDFEDEGELILWKRTLNETGIDIDIPNFAVVGDITIRFIVHYGRIRSACIDCIEGEAEDYTLRIFSRDIEAEVSKDEFDKKISLDPLNLKISPNPILEHTSFLLEHNLNASEMLSVNIYSLDGQLISGLELNGSQKEFTADFLQAGVYIFEIKTHNVILRKKLIVQN